MSAALPRTASAATGVISELALARAQRNTVLIVDDLFSSRLLLAEIVRQIDSKLNLELFDTPSRALEYARNNRVDIVLTDYKLPEFDGIELVKQLRALPHCVDVPIVVITVVDDRKIRYDALEAGATDFLIKPLDDHETRARCANLLELRRHKIVLSDQAMGQSRAIIALSVPKVIPFPEKPVAINCRSAFGPMNGSPSFVSMTWPVQRWSISASGINPRKLSANLLKHVSVLVSWPVFSSSPP